jgi:hypothetical protein
MDIVVTSLGEAVELWQNVDPGKHRWIALQLEGVRSNRDGIGALVRIGAQYNHMTTSLGYGSSSRGAVHFGVENTERIERIEIRWPSGIVQMLEDVPTNQVLRVREPKP